MIDMKSEMSTEIDVEKKYKGLIISLSIFIPLAVGALFGVKVDGYNLSFLPPIYASINAVTAICLIAALVAIKNKNISVHENLMKLSLGLSALFLVAYILYHITSDSTPYGGEGTLKYVYFIILITHILLSIGIIPLVLVSFVKALAKRFDKHKKIAKFTYPLWLYVAVSGVVVYFMISPYYQ